MSRQAFSNFDIGIIILLITLVCGFLIYMVLRLLEIFTDSGKLKKEREKMDIEVLKMEKELVKKAREKKEKEIKEPQGENKGKVSDDPSRAKKDAGDEDQTDESSNNDNKDPFSDIDQENIVQF